MADGVDCEFESDFSIAREFALRTFYLCVQMAQEYSGKLCGMKELEQSVVKDVGMQPVEQA